MFYVKKKIHTLTLGQALMPAGLSAEGRIMRYACGPRRAWLKHYYLKHYFCDSGFKRRLDSEQTFSCSVRPRSE